MIGHEPIVATRQPYVDGKFVVGDGPPLEVDNPATEESVAEVETCSLEQIESSILAARRAFDDGTWSDADRHERAAAVLRLADHFERRYDELATTLRLEAGATATMIATAQLALPLRHIRQAVDLYRSMPEEEYPPRPLTDAISAGRVAISTMRYEPVGVVAAISAYNFPFWLNVWKVIPALLTGNAVVLRPSPLTPLSALAFGEAAEAAGLPPGILNVIVEEGSDGAQLMTTHEAVDAVSFTGSTAVGRAVMRQASETVKRLILELGGKSVQLYLPDAVDRAASGCATVFASHSGQACVAPTRVLVPDDQKDDVVAKAAALASQLRVGNPADPKVVVGPLISAAQRDRCVSYVEAAVGEGGVVAAGGRCPPELDRGYYFEPTVLDVPDNSNPAARDEIFGPVVAVIGYRSVDHAISIANDSIYGLSGAVFGGELSEATAVAKRIRSGAVSVNGGTAHAFASSGGYKQSGIGRERGVEGIRAYQQLKHLSVGNL